MQTVEKVKAIGPENQDKAKENVFDVIKKRLWFY
jgi:hypothetical protein